MTGLRERIEVFCVNDDLALRLTNSPCVRGLKDLDYIQSPACHHTTLSPKLLLVFFTNKGND